MFDPVCILRTELGSEERGTQRHRTTRGQQPMGVAGSPSCSAQRRLYAAMRLLCLDVLSGSSQAESAAQKISDWASTNTSRPARLRTLLNETSVACHQRHHTCGGRPPGP